MLSEELAGDLAFKLEARNAVFKELANLRSTVDQFDRLAHERLKSNRVIDRADAAVLMFKLDSLACIVF